jgi:hypothetical protein
MDHDYLKNLVFTLKNQTPSPGGSCIEPNRRYEGLTPEKLQENLTAFIKACARKTGIEKALLVRKWIERVRYSKKSIGVDFVVDGPGPDLDAGSPTERTGDRARPLDGEITQSGALTSTARSAANGVTSTASRCGLRPGRTTRTGVDSTATKQKESGRLNRSDPSPQFEGGKNGGVFGFPKTAIPLSFPNIAHTISDHYRLTGEFFIRRSKLSV